MADFFKDIGYGLKDGVQSIYYDSGFHDAWSPFANGLTDLYTGFASGVGNIFRGLGQFATSQNLTLLVLVAGAGVVVYGIVTVYNGSGK